MPPKRSKMEDDEGDDQVAEGSKPKRAAAKSVDPWTLDEELILYRAIHELALSNMPLLTATPGLEKRNATKVNVKARAMMKKIEKHLGGDGRWIDGFKGGKKKEGGSKS